MLSKKSLAVHLDSVVPPPSASGGRLDGGAVIVLARTARSLTGTSAELRAASTSLGSILDKIDRGNGSLGRAVNDPTLYQALLAAAAQVDEAAPGAAAFVRDSALGLGATSASRSFERGS